MAVINTGLLTRTLNAAFFERFKQVNTYWERLCSTMPSTQDGEDYKWLGSVPQMREWGTGRKAKGLRSESYSVDNLKYEATLEVDRDEISDDKTGQIAMRVRELAERAATYKDYLVAQLLANGSTAGFNSYDGVPFFDTAHVSGASGNQANEGNFDVGTVAGANLYDEPDSTTLWGPQTALAAFNAAVAAMISFKDDQGEYIRPSLSGLAVVCHPTKWQTWLKAFGAQLLPQVGSNVQLPVGPVQVIPEPSISSAATWYLLKTDGAVGPLIFQDREPMEFVQLAQGSDEEFMREKYYFGVRARFRITYGMWQYAYATTMTT